MQTDKLAKNIGVVLYGREYWEQVLDLQPMAEWGAIADADLELLHYADTPAAAFEHLQDHLVAHHLQPATRTGERRAGHRQDARIGGRVTLKSPNDRSQSYAHDSAPAMLHLLERASAGADPAFERRVFINRTLRMETIEVICFDLDWTLAAYDRELLHRLIFDTALARLVDHYDYPAEIRSAEFRPDFAHRGLLIDKAAGTVVKMDRHFYVGRAYLGRRLLTSAERMELYRRERVDLRRSRFYHVDTLFELAEVNLFSELVELVQRGVIAGGAAGLRADFRGRPPRRRRGARRRHAEVADHRQPAEPAAARRRSAADHQEAGADRPAPAADLELRVVLHRCGVPLPVRAGGARPRLAEAVRPDRGQRPQAAVLPRPVAVFGDRRSRATRPATVEAPVWGGCYIGGSRDKLTELLGVPGERVLYVGDHIYSDILATKMRSTWRTMLIVSELEEEMRIRRRLLDDLGRYTDLNNVMSDLGRRLENARDVVRLRALLGADVSSAEAAELADLDRAVQELARRPRRASAAAR